jgi:DnaJ-class molecular chaperone
MVVSLDAQEMTDGTTSVGFSGRQGFKSVNTTIHEATLRKTEENYNLNKTFDPEKYGMLLCPLCDGKGFIINPKRKCCPKCGGFGLIKKENGPKGD